MLNILNSWIGGISNRKLAISLNSHMANEALVSQCIINYPDKYRVALDIGANHGQYTREMANHFLQVIAVEPHPDNLTKLNEQFKDNRVVSIVPKAITHPASFVRLYTNNNPGGHSISEKVGHSTHWGHDRQRFIDVPGITLDELWAQIKATGQTIGLIKMDIEGAEDFVWEHAEHLVSDNLEWLWIVLEVHQTVDLDRLQELFISRGYAWRSSTDKQPLKLIHDEHYLIQRFKK